MTSSAEKETHVYITDKNSCWIPAIQTEVTPDGKFAVVKVPQYNEEQEILNTMGVTATNGYNRISSQKQAVKFSDPIRIDLTQYPNKVLPMQNVDSNGKLENYRDMVQLPFLHEVSAMIHYIQWLIFVKLISFSPTVDSSVVQPAILYNLKSRHINNKAYTRTGDIVIAVNPYKWFPEIYTEAVRARYSNRLVYDPSNTGDDTQDPRSSLEPHVYEVSALSYRGLITGEMQDQSILVSGESGAGKTETVKICLNHIASTQKGKSTISYLDTSSDHGNDPVVARIVESNPLLEAFGNAQTRRNDNSSRFGKYLQLQFDRHGATTGAPTASLVGSKCEVYLLEKNRVVTHDSEERTFHIMYQLLAAPDSDKSQFWSNLHGKTAKSFKYVGPSQVQSIEGISDANRFRDTIMALEMVGVKGDKLQNLMQAICMVLQLGNLGFQAKSGDSDKSDISTTKEAQDLASLMKLTPDQLSVALTERTFTTKNESHKVPLNTVAASDARDALAKEIYLKSFLWLVGTINDATAFTPTRTEKYATGTIGLLDIFGFEAFETNRFEQLCINYANEKLQQKFTSDIFKTVQEEYRNEGIPLEEIWYDDNTDVLDVIEGRTGLLNLLNEECVRPGGNDFDFVQKSLQINKKSPCLMVHRTDRLSFGIRHYAGQVFYDGDKFVASNQDTLPTDLQRCLEASASPIVNTRRTESSISAKASRESNLVAPTVWGKYKSQLHQLMANLNETRSRYIRCIKPNSKKQPTLYEHASVVEQLRCAGVIAGVTISRAVFPNSLDTRMVISRYSNVWDKKAHPSQKTENMTDAERRASDCNAILACALKSRVTFNVDGKMVKPYVVGKTKCYFRAGSLEWLEGNRMCGLDAQAITLQKAARGWLARFRLGQAGQRKVQEEADRQAAHAARLAAAAERVRERQQRQAANAREENDLARQIALLQQQISESDRSTRKELADIEERKLKARQETEDLDERLKDDLKRKIAMPKAQMAAIETKLAEAKRIIEHLRRENKKYRIQYDDMESHFNKMRTRADTFLAHNEKMGLDFEDIQDDAMRVSKRHDMYVDTLEEAKKTNRRLKDQVHKTQDKYMEQAEARLDLQKAMSKILNVVQDRCRNAQLVEDVVVIALECETEAKCQMAALEAASSIHDDASPELAGTDASDSM
jgi:myosin heavy subunit